jgi:hypothetical protein
MSLMWISPDCMLNRTWMGVTVAALVTVAAAAAQTDWPSATVPFSLDHNRMTVEIEFPRPAGGVRKARAWVDTGGTDLLMSESLARDLGIEVPTFRTPDQSAPSPSRAPAMRVGGVQLDTEGMTVSVRAGRVALPGIEAECTIAPQCLRRLHVVFDYPAGRLTLARPGTLKPSGTPVPCRVNRETGLFMIDAVVDGQTLALGIDNGSAGTWVSDTLTAAWLARHPDWPHATGAAGSTNFFGFPFETLGALMRLPAVAIGAAPPVGDVAVLGLPQGLFDWYSRKSAGTVVGFLGAKVIARFRLEVDFPAQMTWWRPGPPPATRDLDIVGLTIRPESDGSFAVAGVVSRNGRPLVEGVEPNDRLLRVDRLDVTKVSMGAVIDALRGTPGATRTLVLERSGRRIVVQATVARLP